MSRVVNCLKLLQILSSGQVYKKAYLAQLLDTLPRNLHSYRLDLYDAGYDIESIPGKYGGYCMRQPVSLPKLELNTEDIEYIRLVQAFILNSSFTYQTEALLSLSKLTASQEQSRDNLFYHCQNQDQDLLSKQTISVLDSAITQQKIVEFSYTRSDKQYSKRIVNPYALINYLDFWYLIAEDHVDRKMKYFKVSKRMRDVIISHKQFMYDDTFNVNHYLQSEYFFKFKTQDVICEITGMSALIVEEKPAGKLKEMYWIGDTLYYHANFDSLDHATRFVMSGNTDIKLLGPAFLVEHIKSVLDQMTLKYQ